jgi:hypothetical protein
MEEVREGQLVQTDEKDAKVLKVSTIYSPTLVTAEVVYPVPGRTTVREYTDADVRKWREPSQAIIARYEIAWGYR